MPGRDTVLAIPKPGIESAQEQDLVFAKEE
jgi:hypothetical protein